MIRRLGLALTLAFASALPAAAQSVCAVGSPSDGSRILGRQTGLSVPFTAFDFNGIAAGLAALPIVSDPTTAGLTFSGAFFGPQTNLLYSTFPNTFEDGAIYNYGEFTLYSTEIVVNFLSPTRAAAFNFAASAGTSSFKAWKRGAQIGAFDLLESIQVTLPAVSGESRGCWWGFEFNGDQRFDRLTISSTPLVTEPLAFGFDNLRVAPVISTVPEPGTVGLLALGLLGLGATMRRRARKPDDAI